MNKELLEALNDQINMEFGAFYSYLAMATYFESSDLPGFANWMMMQSGEEQAHAMKILHFVQERDEDVTLMAIETPKASYNGPLDVFEASLAQEQRVTESINNLYGLAQDVRDYATVSMLQWFIDEQVEEEANAKNIIAQLRRIGNDQAALHLLDREMSTRTAAPEAAGGEAAA